jgi:outer membrane protein assembly factor BamD (BamD/ComL family)
MKKYIRFIAFCSIASSMISCSGGQKQNSASTNSAQDSSRDGLITNVKTIEAKLSTLPTLDSYNANMAVNAYTRFSNKFPDDSVAPKFLFKAANITMSIGQYDKAIKLYAGICTKYPSFKYVPDCIFVQGFIYDTYMKDTAKAHAKYQEVITKYPDNNLAEQAKAAIAALGKSDEELIKEFQEKNKKKGK